MADDITPMHDYFSRLGLEPEIADVYLALHAYGPQNLFQLARNSRIERTRLYRLVDNLTDSHLVEIETHNKRNIYKAAPFTNLQILISRREQELRELQDDMHKLHAELHRSMQRSPLTHVQSYKGIEGIKQMTWNQTKGKTENLAILYENMQNRTNLAFFERWVERCNKNQLKFRGIISDHFIKTQQDWYARHDNERLAHWEARYVPDSTFLITHSTITYDDVVAYYNWKDGEVFGIEIYNQEIASAQRRVFEMLWQQGQPVDDLIGPKSADSNPKDITHPDAHLN